MRCSTPNQILLKTHYSLISPGTEGAGYTGLESGTRFPHGSGYTAIGEVLKVGENVTKCVAGDLAFYYGPHASIAKTEAVLLAFKSPFRHRRKTGSLCPNGDGRDDLSAGIVCGIRGCTVAIIGLGLVGNSASQLFNLAGMKVISIERVPRRLRNRPAVRYPAPD